MRLETAKTLVEAAVRSGSEESLHELVDWAMGNPVSEEGVVILEIFDVLQSKEALLQLQMLAYSHSAPALVSAARQKLEEISQSRGMRVWELEDLIVPPCGLDSEERYPFMICGKACQLRLNGQLEPFFVDECGMNVSAVKGDLTPEIQRVVDDLTDVLPTQILRLEMALATEQRWGHDHWKENVMGHPVLGHLVKRLIWGAYSESGRLHQTFRVSEEGELSDMDDMLVEVEDGLVIGVLHPLSVSPDVLSGWNATLADYEIPTLCPQLDRPAFTHDPELAKSQSLSIGYEVFGEGTPIDQVESGLLSRGWQLTSAYYGVFYEKIFRHADIKVQIQLNQSGELIQSASLTFQRFLGHPRHNFQFRDISPLVYSEALLDVKLVSGTHQHSR